MVDVDGSLKEGQIYNSNLYSIGSRIKELGAEPVVLGIGEDDEISIAESIEEGIRDVDILVTTGGVSVGEKDLLQGVMKCIGAEILFWKIDLKPGSPALCSVLNGKLIVSLSGNPSGAAITFELLVRPLIAKMSNREDIKLCWINALFKDEFGKKSPRRRFIWAEYKYTEKGTEVKLTEGMHSPGVLKPILGSNCLIDVPGGTQCLNPGKEVRVLLL